MARHSTPTLSISDLVASSGVDAVIHGDGSLLVSGISQDSRSIQPGDLFCCVRGDRFDGHEFVNQAVDNGAVAVLVQRRDISIPAHIAQIEVVNVREALGYLASAMFGFPARSLSLVGITGTNGKTTTAAILQSILEAAGRKTEVIGTLSGIHTTPEAIDIQALLRRYLDEGVQAVVMEVSSHALAQYRTNGLVFDVVVFTNLGHDHLDFHGTQEAYFAAKARLFDATLARHGVVNLDDSFGRRLNDGQSIPMVQFSRRDVDDVFVAIDHVAFRWNDTRIEVPIGGDFSVINALAAITTADVLGVSNEDIKAGCSLVKSVPGRFEAVPNDAGIDVVVDFAHTPDGLEGLLRSVGQLTSGRIVVVFGCGGERDLSKRPLMGAIAATLADEVIVTSDNPRGEDPEMIISSIISGISDSSAAVRTIVNRADAIESAINSARRGDIVVIAGKGHEKTQDINGVLIPFSDVEVATEALKNRKGD